MKINPQNTFGWNADVWNRAFFGSNEVQKIIARKNMKVLEIGAGKYSQVSCVFDSTQSHITVGYYDKKISFELKQIINKKIKDFNLISQYEIQFIDAFNFDEKYDVVILKSVLGGIFRGDDFYKAEEFCQKIVRENLNENGALITIDNGKSILEFFLKRLGARKNKWHFTTLNELIAADEKVGFGLLSSFSFSNRLGKLGVKLEKFLYYIDLILYPLFSSKPTVICSVYKKHNPV